MNEQIALQRVLHDYFAEMKIRNPAFSLRAFADRLQVSAPAISEILNGKRRVSRKLAEKMIVRVCDNPEEAQKILRLFPRPKGASSVAEDEKFELSNAYTHLSIDHFQMISHWQHFAILSLANTKEFRADPYWIARRLSLKVGDTIQAIERLERMGFLEWDRRKKKINLKKAQFSTPEDVASAAIRAAHCEDLETARRKLEEIPVDLREFTSITMSVDARKLAAAKKMIREFRDQLSNFLESGQQSEVYRFCLYLFPLSNPSEEK